MLNPLHCLLFFGLAVSLPAMAQPVPKPAPVPSSKAAPQPVPDDPADATLEHVKFPYRPSLVRDPFQSPTDSVDKTRAESIDEIGIKGRLVSKGKTMAIILDSRGKTRMLPVGYRFKDGEIVAITDKAVLFRQWDPTSTNRARTKSVEKLFKREEGNR